MKKIRSIGVLGTCLSLLSIGACLWALSNQSGEGPFKYTSIRGQEIEIYGIGPYRHMPSDVAIPGIAQDWATLLAALPLWWIGFFQLRKGKARAPFLLAGTSFYFFVTYMFYTAMGMYSELFLVHAALISLSFFSVWQCLYGIDVRKEASKFSPAAPHKAAGWFLIISAVLIALLWLSMVVPPLLDGSLYPVELAHFTTLIVQGFDLGLLLPISLVCGLALKAGKPEGFVFGTCLLVFLGLLMAALTAKLIAMGLQGQEIIPAIFLIPSFMLLASYFSFRMLHTNPKIP
jgi:hypothetical protein